MPTSDTDWIKQRLPAGASFAKNGLALTVDQAIAAALEDAGGNKYLALAGLLEVLAANDTKESESFGEYSYSGSLLREQADYWRAMAESLGDPAGPGAFANVPITYQDQSARDEYTP